MLSAAPAGTCYSTKLKFKCLFIIFSMRLSFMQSTHIFSLYNWIYYMKKEVFNYGIFIRKKQQSLQVPDAPFLATDDVVLLAMVLLLPMQKRAQILLLQDGIQKNYTLPKKEFVDLDKDHNIYLHIK